MLQLHSGGGCSDGDGGIGAALSAAVLVAGMAVLRSQMTFYVNRSCAVRCAKSLEIAMALFATILISEAIHP